MGSPACYFFSPLGHFQAASVSVAFTQWPATIARIGCHSPFAWWKRSWSGTDGLTKLRALILLSAQSKITSVSGSESWRPHYECRRASRKGHLSAGNRGQLQSLYGLTCDEDCGPNQGFQEEPEANSRNHDQSARPCKASSRRRTRRVWIIDVPGDSASNAQR